MGAQAGFHGLAPVATEQYAPTGADRDNRLCQNPQSHLIDGAEDKELEMAVAEFILSG